MMEPGNSESEASTRLARHRVRQVEAWMLDQGVPYVVRFAGGHRLLARMVPGLLFILIGTVSANVASLLLGPQDQRLAERLESPDADDATLLLSIAVVLIGLLVAALAAILTARHRGRSGDQVASPRAGVVLLAVLTLVPIINLVVSGSLSRLLEDLFVTAAPVALLALLVYSGVGALLAWGIRQVIPHYRDLLRLLSRALPLQLVLVAFLFINTEAWQVADALSPVQLVGIVSFFLLAGLVFIIARVPGELAGLETELTGDAVRDACHGTPLQRLALDLGPSMLSTHPLGRWERMNLILTVVFSVGVQVVFLGILMFVALVFFGATAIQEEVIASWVQHDVNHLALLPGSTVTFQLVKVSIVIASFAALQFATQAVTEQSFRSEFFDDLVAALSRTLVARDVYLSALDRHAFTGLPSVDLDDDLDRALDPRSLRGNGARSARSGSADAAADP